MMERGRRDDGGGGKKAKIKDEGETSKVKIHFSKSSKNFSPNDNDERHIKKYFNHLSKGFFSSSFYFLLFFYRRNNFLCR